jgi:hypothetical protein
MLDCRGGPQTGGAGLQAGRAAHKARPVLSELGRSIRLWGHGRGAAGLRGAQVVRPGRGAASGTVRMGRAADQGELHEWEVATQGPAKRQRGSAAYWRVSEAGRAPAAAAALCCVQYLRLQQRQQAAGRWAAVKICRHPAHAKSRVQWRRRRWSQGLLSSSERNLMSTSSLRRLHSCKLWRSACLLGPLVFWFHRLSPKVSAPEPRPGAAVNTTRPSNSRHAHLLGTGPLPHLQHSLAASSEQQRRYQRWSSPTCHAHYHTATPPNRSLVPAPPPVHRAPSRASKPAPLGAARAVRRARRQALGACVRGRGARHAHALELCSRGLRADGGRPTCRHHAHPAHVARRHVLRARSGAAARGAGQRHGGASSGAAQPQASRRQRSICGQAGLPPGPRRRAPRRRRSPRCASPRPWPASGSC